MEILIVKTSAIGDVTHTLPALNCLRLKYPQARITWLVEEAAADLVIGHQALDKVLVSKRKKWFKELRRGDRFSALKKITGFVKELRRVRFDLIIDFQGLLKSGVLVGLARGGRKVGFGRGMQHAECSYIFLNERLPAVDMDIHALDRELLLLKAIGVECEEINFNVPITAHERQQAGELLGEAGENRKLVAINPQTKWPTKLWDNKKFALAADELAGRGCLVFFTGAPADRPVVAEIQADMQNPSLNLAGRSSLKTLAALYETADLVISTDTGPMHIAAAVNTPVVALFGPTAPWRTGPYGDCHQVLRTGVACSPCFKKNCPLETGEQKKCMNEISADQVVEAAAGIIDL